MNTHTDKTTETKSNAVANGMAVQQGAEHEGAFQLEDNRPQAIAQRKIQEAANNSPQINQLKDVQALANSSAQAKQLRAVQAMADNHTEGVVQKKLTRVDNTADLYYDDFLMENVKIEEEIDDDLYIIEDQTYFLRWYYTPSTDDHTPVGAGILSHFDEDEDQELVAWPDGYDQASAGELGIFVEGKLNLTALRKYPHITAIAIEALKRGAKPNETMAYVDTEWVLLNKGAKVEVWVHNAGKMMSVRANKPAGKFVGGMKKFDEDENALNVPEDHILHTSTHVDKMGMGHRHSVKKPSDPKFDPKRVQALVIYLNS